MLARIQTFIALALLGAVLAASLAGQRIGAPWLGFGILVAVVGAYAGVLAIEFVWMRSTYASDDLVRPTARQLIRAWAAEVVTAPRVFLWRQPFRSRSEPDRLAAHRTGQRGVLFVHGFFCNRGLWNPWLRKLSERGIPFVAVDLEPVTGSIDDYHDIIDNGVRALERATGNAPVIVAHSMGGLAARAWRARHPDGPMHRLVAIATPHAGTRLGGRSRGANVGQMKADSDWLATLAAGETASDRSRIVCFWGHCDNIVFPTRSATLAGADNRHLAATPHVRMVYHEEVFAEVMRLLKD